MTRQQQQRQQQHRRQPCVRWIISVTTMFVVVGILTTTSSNGWLVSSLLLQQWGHNRGGGRGSSFPRFVSALATTTTTADRSNNNVKKYSGGAGVGRLVIDFDGDNPNEIWQCHYDMVLCERIQGKPKTESGLFVPQEDLPKLHLCRVLSLGTGRVEENGSVAPMPDIQVGDIVIAKNPWGIGPKDEETISGKKLSFMRSQDIAAVITGGLIGEDHDFVSK